MNFSRMKRYAPFSGGEPADHEATKISLLFQHPQPVGARGQESCRWSPARIGRAAVRVSCRPRITTGPRSISRADLSEVFALFLIYSQSGWSMEFIGGGVQQKTFLHAVSCARCALRVNKRARQFRLANFLDPRHSVHPRPVQHYSESSERWVCRNDQGYSRGAPGFTAPARRFCVPEVTWACCCNCGDSAAAASIAGLRGRDVLGSTLRRYAIG
jgi:hypothetical protein